MSRYVCVTGGAGFIGRVVVRKLLEAGHKVYCIDALTYAADPKAIAEFSQSPNFCFVNRDIRDPELSYLPDVDCVIHLAAESHVDRSINGPERFVSVNVSGTAHLLELARKVQPNPLFLYVSTDEVYGDMEPGQQAKVGDPMNPSSPYAASKAGADLLVQSYGRTFGLPYLIVRPTNCYGNFQYPEKLIPKAVRSLLLGRPIPIHGDGTQTRQWLWVNDAADAILFAMNNAEKVPPIVNVGGNQTVDVRTIAQAIACHMNISADLHRAPLSLGHSRPGGDMRYWVDDLPLREAGWRPQGDFWVDLSEIVENEARTFRF